MKKIIALALCLTLILATLAGCKDKGGNSDLENAKAYLINMYQKGDKDEVMEMLLDTDVLAVVTVDGISYDVEWSITVTEGASDAVKISESEEENHVLIDVPDVPEEDILFTATATIKDEDGNSVAANFEYKVVGIGAESSMSAEQILTEAFALEEGQKMEGTQVLTGKIVSIDTPYSEQYKNVTVTIVVDGFEDKPVQCYRLEGDDAATIAIGDYITVSGTLTNYKGKVQFEAKCVIKEVVKGDESSDDAANQDGSSSGSGASGSSGGSSGGSGGSSGSSGGSSGGSGGSGGSAQTVTDVAKIMKEAFALAEGASLPYTSVLTGKVIAVDEEYDPEFKNITVTIKVNGYDDKPIVCYRLKGTGVEKVQKNDTITVSGTIKNHYGKIEFDLPTLTKRISGGGVTKETDPAKIMAAAYALNPGENLGYEVTLEGKVQSIKTPYDPSFDNISVVISVAGKDLLCYRMVGNDVSKVVGGDTITVTGMIKNYNGTIEFDAGCTMRKRVSGGVTVITDPKKIVDEAFKLEPGKSLPYSVTLTGTITAIATEYSEQYKNITVIIQVEGSDGMKELKCYRMKGEGAQNLKVGDVITVTGIIKNYQHSSGDCEVEFDAGCTFVKK